MSTKFKIYKLIAAMLFISGTAISQSTTVEMPAQPFLPDGNGITALPRTITFQQDVNNAGTGFTPYTPGVPPTPVTLTVSFGTQTYTGLPYGSCPTGLIFGAAPTDGTGAGAASAIPYATPIANYTILGAFNGTGALGPQNNMFNSTPIAAAGANGTGIDAINATGFANGGVSVFTAAQALFDGPGGLQPYNNTTRYEYGTIVLTFSQFVANPVIHFAGLGGAYRYQFQTGGGSTNPANWRSTFFTTELELVSPIHTLTYMSGNPNFSVSGNRINNTATTPNGGSAIQNPLIGLFNNYGAATGSVRISGAVKTIVFKVTLRGGVGQDFAWSALQSDLLNSANRPPFTGDIWSVAASFQTSQLIPLPATGLKLTAALNGNDVQLNWKTLSEDNTRNFEIERSTDGINYSQIAAKAAAGSSYVESNYSLVDANMTSSVYYYRVKLVDNDSRSTYSNIAIVRKTGGIKGVRTFPNPAISQLNVEFSNAKGNYTVSLYNQVGQEVLTQRANINYSVQYVTINRNSLPAGSYILKVKNTETTDSFTEKVVLQ